MFIRYEVDQAEAFRRGIDCPKSIVGVDVNPADLSKEDRNLIADRLDGIDVCQLYVDSEGEICKHPVKVIAVEPTFDALMEAIRKDQQKIEEKLSQLKRPVTTVVIPNSKIAKVREF